jgi:hypothetical protein
MVTPPPRVNAQPFLAKQQFFSKDSDNLKDRRQHSVTLTLFFKKNSQIILFKIDYVK